MRQFLKFVLYGAAMTLGGLIVNSVANVMRDPYKRAGLKRKFNGVKKALKE